MKKMNKKLRLASMSCMVMIIIAASVLMAPTITNLTASKNDISETLLLDNDTTVQSVEVAYEGIGFGVFKNNKSNSKMPDAEVSESEITTEEPELTDSLAVSSSKNVNATRIKTSRNKKAELSENSTSSSATEDDASIDTEATAPKAQIIESSVDASENTPVNDPVTPVVEETKVEPVADTAQASSDVPKVDPEPVVVEDPAEEPKADTAPGAFYVSKSGNDSNPGTEAAPWKTIQKAASTLKAGQTVYVKEGTYNERVMVQNSGTSGNYITFTNYPGHRVVVDGAGIDWGYNWECLFNTNGKDYIKVNGFRVINSRWAGIGSEKDSDSGNHVIISNCSTYNTKASGIAYYNASNITIEGNSVEKACTAQGSQEAISICNVNTFTIRNNTVFNITNSVQGAGGEGIDAKDGSSNGKIYNNTVHDVVKIGIYVDAYKRTSSNIQVYGNNVYNCGEGITVATEKGGLLKNVNIYSNSIRNCSTGFSIAGWENGYSHDMDTIKFNSNTISGASSRGIYLNNADAVNVYITNNNISGSSSMIPIHLNGGVMAETTIDGNVFDRTIDLALAGTNYTFN